MATRLSDNQKSSTQAKKTHSIESSQQRSNLLSERRTTALSNVVQVSVHGIPVHIVHINNTHEAHSHTQTHIV